MQQVWTPEEVELLKQAYTTLPTKEIYSIFLYRTKKSVQRKATELGLKRPTNIKLTSKICTSCQKNKPIDEFGPDKRVRDLHQSHCRKCVYLYTKQRRLHNPSLVRREYARRKGSRYISLVEIDAIYKRLNGICYLCDKHIDRSLRYPHPMSLSIDHKIPISKDGDHILENLYPTHLRCNLRKSDRIIDG